MTVPFTPVTGRRVLVRAGEDRAVLTELVAAARCKLAQAVGATRCTCCFRAPRSRGELEAAGWRGGGVPIPLAKRGYGESDLLGAASTPKRRNQAKRERAPPAQAGARGAHGARRRAGDARL